MQTAAPLIFDSAFDLYRGVITYVRVQEGTLPSNAKIKMFATNVVSEAELDDETLALARRLLDDHDRV